MESVGDHLPAKKKAWATLSSEVMLTLTGICTGLRTVCLKEAPPKSCLRVSDVDFSAVPSFPRPANRTSYGAALSTELSHANWRQLTPSEPFRQSYSQFPAGHTTNRPDIEMGPLSRSFGPQSLLLLTRQQAPSKCIVLSPPPQLRSRNLLFCLVGAHPRSPLQQQLSRTLQTAAKAPSKPLPPKRKPNNSDVPVKTPTKTPTTTPTTTPATTYANQLALRPRVLLFEAPSHFWYRLSSLGASAFCITYTVYQYWTVLLHPPADIASWVPTAFGVICVFMGSIGVYFALGTSRIVRSISAVSVASALATGKGKLPSALLTLSNGRKAASAAAASKSPIYIEVQTQRMLPFLPMKRIQLWPEQIRLPFRMSEAIAARGDVVPTKAAGPAGLRERVQAERAEREAKAKARKYEMDHLMTAPFRDAKKGFRVVWDGMSRAFHRGGFAQVELGGKNYKLDVSGWAMENGRAMDRILALKKTPGR